LDLKIDSIKTDKGLRTASVIRLFDSW